MSAYQVSRIIHASIRITFKEVVKDGQNVAEVYINDNYIMDTYPQQENINNFAMG